MACMLNANMHNLVPGILILLNVVELIHRDSIKKLLSNFGQPVPVPREQILPLKPCIK